MSQHRVGRGLAVELLLHIIESVGDHQSGSYILSQTTLKTYRSLSLASRAFHQLADATLHRRVYLTPVNIKAFVRRLADPLSAIPTSVQYLAFAHYGEDEFSGDDQDDVLFVMHHLPDTVKNLLFDLPLRNLYHTEDAEHFHEATATFTQIEELISTQDEVSLAGWTAAPVLWPDWTNLRRLAIYNIDLVSIELWDALAMMPHLEQFWVLDPRGPHTFISTPLSKLIDKTPSTLNHLWIDAENFLPYSDLGEDYREFAKDEGCDEQVLEAVLKYGDRFRIVDAGALGEFCLPRDPESTPSEWFLYIASVGRLWTLDQFAVPQDVCQQRLERTRLESPLGTPELEGLVLPIGVSGLISGSGSEVDDTGGDGTGQSIADQVASTST